MQTDQWLEDDFSQPYKICERLLPSFEKGTSAKELYRYLSGFGMYKPSRSSMEALQWLKEEDIWKGVQHLYQKYQRRWRGPDIEIFIFPKDNSSFFRKNYGENKSGVSFPDKMFLFVSPLEEQKELEALFIHEFHHICRIRVQQKNVRNYTLLDSIVLEGTAEFTAEQICGKKYRAEWCNLYSAEVIEEYWHSFIRKNLTINKNHRLHDAILFGRNRFPKLIGYAAGYHLVSKYYHDHSYSEKSSLSLRPETFLQKL